MKQCTRSNAHWKTGFDGLRKLEEKNRIFLAGNILRYKMFFSDFPVVQMNNIWKDLMGASDMRYVVQTNEKVIQRCLLMSTDPGDLVLDITCLRKGTKILVPARAFPPAPARGGGALGLSEYEIRHDCPVCEESEGMDASYRRAVVRTAVSHRVRGDGRGGDLRSASETEPHAGERNAGGLLQCELGDERVVVFSQTNEMIRHDCPVCGESEGMGASYQRAVVCTAVSHRVRGDGRGGAITTKAIENIRPGDFVYTHTGKAKRVTQVIVKKYTGTMIGIHTEQSAEPMWVTCDHRVLVKRRRYEFNGKANWSHVPQRIFTRAHELRHEKTLHETMLWNKLRMKQLGARFRQQHPIGGYIADFFCPERALVVEVDGVSHFTEEGIEHDAVRTEYFESCGLHVLRFTNKEVEDNLEGVVTRIRAVMGEEAVGFFEEAYWVEAQYLTAKDIVYTLPQNEEPSALPRVRGLGQSADGSDCSIYMPVKIVSILADETSEEVYDLTVEDAHSFVTETCIVHNCGSGTTAYVAEQWGRRWITCDTSRVAITLAKQRLMTAKFDYYELAYPKQGVKSGFKYKTVPHITLGSIANNEPPKQETLYDQPFIEKGKVRVTGPFTVEAVPSLRVKPFDGTMPKLEVNGAELARTGETGKQAEWRDELKASGIRATGGQMIEFTLVEPMTATRFLHARAEIVSSSEFSVKSDTELKTQNSKLSTAYISFGPDYGPLEQRQAEAAIDEARKLKDKPDFVIFAAFHFDPEASKDIDQMEWKGVTILKAQMSVDLLTSDLRRKRSSNQSYWLIGQPDVEVKSFQFLVDSNERRIAEYESFKIVSGLDSLEKINGLGSGDLRLYAILSQGRDVWHYLANQKVSGIDFAQHSGRASEKHQGGIPPVSWNSQGIDCRIGNPATDFKEFGISGREAIFDIVGKIRGNSENARRIDEVFKIVFSGKFSVLSASQNLKLKTYHSVRLNGFDYYNPATGEIESKGTKQIAMWFLDTDYDERSIMPDQVFFPEGDGKRDWTRLARALQAEVNEEALERFSGVISMPFSAGEHKRIAIKIIDNRGVESFVVKELE